MSAWARSQAPTSYCRDFNSCTSSMPSWPEAPKTTARLIIGTTQDIAWRAGLRGLALAKARGRGFKPGGRRLKLRGRRLKLIVERLRYAAQGSQSGKHFGEFDAQVITVFRGVAVHGFAQKYRVADLDFHGCAVCHGLGRDEPQAAARGILDCSGQARFGIAENGEADGLVGWDAMFTPLFHEEHIGGKRKTYNREAQASWILVELSKKIAKIDGTHQRGFQRKVDGLAKARSVGFHHGSLIRIYDPNVRNAGLQVIGDLPEYFRGTITARKPRLRRLNRTCSKRLSCDSNARLTTDAR